jgi:hypothetical protein
MRLSLTPSIQELDALSEFARVERRMPLDAARFLIAEGLARRGLIPPPVVSPQDTPERHSGTDRQEGGRDAA